MALFYRCFWLLISCQRILSVYKENPQHCVARRESRVHEDGKASCDRCRKRKVACDLSRRKLCRAKAKWKGGYIIDSDEDAQGEPEPKRRKVDAVPVVEIQQPATGSLSLFRDLIAVLRDHVKEQQKQTAILERIARVQEMDREDWAFNGSKGSEMGTEGSEEEEEAEEADGNRQAEKVDKGKEKERAEDRNGDGKKDRDGNGNGDGNVNREAGGSGNREVGRETLQ